MYFATVVRMPLPDSMRAVVLDAPGPPEALHVRTLPIPEPRPGWVLIEVKAFGLNRSELQTRLGFAGDAVTYPRVLGIEATGVVIACPGGELAVGTQVAAMMGDMGRRYDGGYAEYTCVPVAQAIPFASDLPWATLGAVPEMLQTANGSLTVGLDLQPGQTLLVRGGTSSIGMTAAILGKRMGATVIATTRSASKMEALHAIGVDHVLVDGGVIADDVRGLVPDGVDATLELIGTPTLADSLAATRVHGTVCCTGALSNVWIVPDFYPTGYIPSGVRLTGYGGDASDLPQAVLQEFLDAVAAAEATVPIAKTYTMDEIATAHDDMEHDRVAGKLVVSTGELSRCAAAVAGFARVEPGAASDA
jgi:NADPH2:quinone reductase